MRFSAELAPAKEGCAIVERGVRISVISDRIIRIERGDFTDKRTQTVVCRDFANTQFTSAKDGDKLVIRTKSRVFYVDLKSLDAEVEFAADGHIAKPSNRTNLGGTARTLDGTFGLLGGWKGKREKRDRFFFGHIRKGIFATNGVSEFEDGGSALLNEDGSVSPRSRKCVDKYIFAFGNDYLGGLKEFYALTGATPVLPKYALSNWWSRYHAYTDKEYLALMDKFKSKDIPITVATVDMDWHIVKNVPRGTEYHSMQGAGWTGYTFEKSLFPDYKAFLKGLKDRGLAVTMNLHPRDGVRSFEEQYPDMARACGIDPASGETVQFDLTDNRFLNAYFDILHHPYERDGVDFWWIDWQQGTKSKTMGLDPLWLLNHYHFLDNCRDGNRGLILSRYAGLGSHRYPLGFSGDTFVCWRSLNFQPYFTALASNAGYTWWSHDIGGHLYGKGNEELYLRWLQFGVFSPINRLHSNNKAWSKEPWLYPHVEGIAEEFLRLRHRLLPYLYTANVRTASEGVPLIAPMYYYTDDARAMQKKWRNQYYFGESMLVAPVTKKGKKGVANIKVWLPDGEWTHFFSGEKFKGGEHDINCALNDYPVFVKNGSIIPMLKARSGNSQTFDEIELRVFVGEGKYTMHDEQGSIAFDMQKDGDGYILKITPSADSTTKSITVTANDGYTPDVDTVPLNGEPVTVYLKK
ncbi:MAG: hypothetical protein NC037_03270 [Bacteroides sp.]|nr:alpha-xylosidase [Bacillota bacterium]MCM1393381.1 alpha-xylosidase [[Eubacterium] siraeum]MCM1455529.1 hypothetical protein [Bacteroides sp.]